MFAVNVFYLIATIKLRDKSYFTYQNVIGTFYIWIWITDLQLPKVQVVTKTVCIHFEIM